MAKKSSINKAEEKAIVEWLYKNYDIERFLDYKGKLKSGVLHEFGLEGKVRETYLENYLKEQKKINNESNEVISKISNEFVDSMSNTIIGKGLKNLYSGIETTINNHKADVKSLEDSGPVGKVVAKYKYGSRDIEDEKDTARNQHLLKAFVKIGLEKAIDNIRSEPGDWLINKFDAVDVFKGASKLDDGISTIERAGEFVVAVGKIIDAYGREIPINTAVEGLTFYSLDAWNEFYDEVRNAREVELEQTLDHIKPGKLNQYKVFDELMKIELKRYLELLFTAEKYSDNKVLKWWNTEGFLEIVTGRTSPYLNMIKRNDKINAINAERDTNKQEILGREIRSFPSYGLNDIYVEAYDRTSRRKKMTNQDISHNLSCVSAVTAPSNIENQLSLLKEKIKDSLGSIEISDISLQTSDLFVKTFEDPSAKAIEDIDKMMEKCKILNNFLKSSSEERDTNRKNIAEQLGITEEALKDMERAPDIIKKVGESTSSVKKPLNDFANNIKEGFKNIKNGGVTNIGEGITQIGGAINSMMPSLNKFATDMGTIFGSDTGTDIQNTLNVISATAEAGVGVGKIMAGDFTGIFDAVSGTAKVLEHSKKINKEHEKALELINAQTKAQENAYRLEKLKKDLNYEKGNTVFGSDGYGKASNAASNYQQSINALKVSMNELNNIDIVTGSKKSGWGPWKKRKDVYSDILAIYPDLINADGLLNKELAQTVMNERKMSDESKASLQNMINYAEQAEAAYAEMNNYLTSIFGDLGNQMTDAIVDAFKNGTDAMDSFSQSASAMLEQLVKDMVYSITLAPVMEKAQKEMESIAQSLTMSDEQKLDAYMDVVDKLIDDAVKQQDEANQILGYAQDIAAKKDIEIFADSNRQGTTGQGVASITQDSANELNGNFYALRQQVGDIRNFSNESLLVQRTMQSQLARVAENTEYCRYLENVKNSLEDIQTRGVKVKV